MSQLTRSAVRVFGTLSALGEGQGNVLNSILPFFEPVLRNRNGEHLDPRTIAADIRNAYRWNFNSDVVEFFVPLLREQGWITKEIVDSRDSTYIISLPEAEALPDETAVASKFRELATRFRDFAHRLSPLPEIPRDIAEFEDILVEWLLYVEAFDDRYSEVSEKIIKTPEGKLARQVVFPRATNLTDEQNFLCARFVQHILAEQADLGEFMAKISAIGLLTEVVQDFVKPVTRIDKTDLVVYLDAPVAMELIGLSGSAARDNTAPIIAELQRMGAAVRVFGQSVEEIKSALTAVLNNPRPTGPTAQAILRKEVLRDFVRAASLDPTPMLAALGVGVAVRSLDQTPATFKYFTEEQWRDLYSRLNYVDNPHARQHDADIVALTVRQRAGTTSPDIFKSRALVITRNGVFAQIIARLTREQLSTALQVVPPVIHRRALSAAMWLRTGLGAGNLQLPKRLLLANCERVLALRPNVVDAVKRMTDAIDNPELSNQLDMLVTQDRSAQVLMDKTLGSVNVVTEGNLHLLFKEMLEPHLEEERTKGSNELKSQQIDYERKLALEKARAETLAREKSEEERRLAQLVNQIAQEDREVAVKICEDVQSVLRRRLRLRWVAGGVLAALATLPVAIPSGSGWAKAAVLVVGYVSAFLTVTGSSLLNLSTSEQFARL
ncbi:hypothetical protein [Paracoccus sanguinis]|uniref:hypothetical protein n=1 Tax=Paracoccus sanguinis TaxID=1545044 RepID=UPI000A86BC61|nr:hypothetical protein [Paracoccus sanguinis]